MVRRLLAVVALVAAVACTPENDPAVVDSTPVLDVRANWQATLSGATGFTAVRGSTQIKDYGPYFDLTMTLSNGAPAGAYSWRIFPGTCAAPGAAQFGPVQAYPNFVADANGAAQVQRTIAGPLNLTATYNVRVSTVATPVRIVACGDLQH